MYLVILLYPGIGKAETGEHFAGIIVSLLFPYAGNKNGEQAGKQNDRTHIIYDFYQKDVRPLYFRRKVNARGIERYSKHSSTTSPPCADVLRCFPFFCYLLPIFNDQRTISENRVFHTCMHVSCDENAENRNADMFVTTVLHCTNPGK